MITPRKDGCRSTPPASWPPCFRPRSQAAFFDRSLPQPGQQAPLAHIRTKEPRGRSRMNQEPDEATTREINAQSWEPLPGMIKRQCPECQYWFATWPGTKEKRCKDCAQRSPKG
jgi:hypothetical protein